MNLCCPWPPELLPKGGNALSLALSTQFLLIGFSSSPTQLAVRSDYWGVPHCLLVTLHPTSGYPPEWFLWIRQGVFKVKLQSSTAQLSKKRYPIRSLLYTGHLMQPGSSCTFSWNWAVQPPTIVHPTLPLPTPVITLLPHRHTLSTSMCKAHISDLQVSNQGWTGGSKAKHTSSLS